MKKTNLIILSLVFVVGLSICVFLIQSRRPRLRDSYATGLKSPIRKTIQLGMNEVSAQLLNLKEVQVLASEITVRIDKESIGKLKGSVLYLNRDFQGDSIRLSKSVTLSELRPPADAVIIENDEQKQHGFLMAYSKQRNPKSVAYTAFYITSIDADSVTFMHYIGQCMNDGGACSWGSGTPSRVVNNFKVQD